MSFLLAVEHEFLGVNSCIFVVGMLLCLLSSAAIKRYNIYQLPESAAFMMIGFVGGCFAQLSDAAERQFITFSPNLVFFIILPPIILSAGYTLKRKDFFDSLGPVTLLATLGTTLNNLFYGFLMFGFANAGWIPLDANNPLECLLFGALISATDPVATLSLMGSKLVNTDPMLYSLVMGESVLNDGIAIVLYKAFEASVQVVDNSSDEISSKTFTFPDLVLSLLSFVGVSMGSVICGIAVGLGCSLLCKRVNLNIYPISELSLVTLFAYLSYFMAEMMYLSGIMSLFFCSICLAHYNYYNLTPVAQVAIHESFTSNATIAETALYALLGVTMGLSIQGPYVTYHIGLIICTIIACLVARAAMVFPLCALSNLSREPSKHISLRMQIPLWFAGLRGGVSFALSLSFPGPHRPLIMGATLMLVIFTTFIGGGLTLPLLRCTGMTGSTVEAIQDQQRKLSNRQESKVDEGDAPSESPAALYSSPSISDLEEIDDSDSPDLEIPDYDDAPPSPSSLTNPATDPNPARPRGFMARFKYWDEMYFRHWFGARTSMRDEDGHMRQLPHVRSREHMRRRVSHLAQHAAALSPSAPFPGGRTIRFTPSGGVKLSFQLPPPSAHRTQSTPATTMLTTPPQIELTNTVTPGVSPKLPPPALTSASVPTTPMTPITMHPIQPVPPPASSPNPFLSDTISTASNLIAPELII